MVERLDPQRALEFGPGLVLKDQDLINLPKSIPPHSSLVMDSCVMVLRETLLVKPDPSSEPRADILPCGFVVSLANLYSKFKKTAQEGVFEFDEDLVNSVRGQFTDTKKEWVKDINFLYFPFNIDKNRWIGVMVDLVSSILTVFDPTSDQRRGSKLKPELDFLYEMLPCLV